jgi:hypothetical protein
VPAQTIKAALKAKPVNQVNAKAAKSLPVMTARAVLLTAATPKLESASTNPSNLERPAMTDFTALKTVNVTVRAPVRVGTLKFARLRRNAVQQLVMKHPTPAPQLK